MASLDVLVTAASRRVPLVTAFQRAVRDLPQGGRVVVTDVNPLSPAVRVADAAYQVPLAGDAGYIDALLDICAAEGIGLLVPTIDDELPIVAAARPRFEAQGVQVAVSSVETTETCNDKLATCTRLRRHGVRAARTWRPSELGAAPPLPLFVKPRHGRGGVGAFPARTARELAFFSTYVQDAVVQELLDGPEYTVDVLCDFDGRVLSAVPRERVVIRAGVMDRGRTVDDPALIDLAIACARVLAFRGARQHPVPGGARTPRGVRDQRPFLGRHPADDRRRREPAEDAGGPRARPRGRAGARRVHRRPLADQLRVVVLPRG